jgi:formylglycine-generating enzyme required for sulfatase activity
MAHPREPPPADRQARRGRRATGIVVAAIALGSLLVGVTGAQRVMRELPCAPGFLRKGARCLPAPGEGPGAACPAPLVATPGGCDAPERDVVEIPSTTVVVGPSDWEAEGRVTARTLRVAGFALDRFEVTAGRARTPGSPLAAFAASGGAGDAARALGGVTRAEARAYCAWRGGRLPTEDEWIVAAAGDRPRRYPWGDTGAVCRRAAWGLLRGPCAEGASGSDTVGAHPEGMTPLGVHDLAGNVAEWVEVVEAVEAVEPGSASKGVVRGGSYATDMAAALRTWVRAEVPPDVRDPTVGFRCAYSSTPDGGVR